MKDDFHFEAREMLRTILNTENKDIKLKTSVRLMQYTFKVQKQFLIAIRDILKNKVALGPQEVNAIKSSVESLISGVNAISRAYDKILKNEYKVN